HHGAASAPKLDRNRPTHVSAIIASVRMMSSACRATHGRELNASCLSQVEDRPRYSSFVLRSLGSMGSIRGAGVGKPRVVLGIARVAIPAASSFAAHLLLTPRLISSLALLPNASPSTGATTSSHAYNFSSSRRRLLPASAKFHAVFCCIGWLLASPANRALTHRPICFCNNVGES